MNINETYKNKYMWNNPILEVPKDLLFINKKGKDILKPPLTKKMNISKTQKKPSIQIVYSNDDKFHLISNTIGDIKHKINKELLNKTKYKLFQSKDYTSKNKIDNDNIITPSKKSKKQINQKTKITQFLK